MSKTPEQLYQQFHKYTFYFKSGETQYPRLVENFDNIKAKPEWNAFVQCSEMLERNAGQVNGILLIYSLAKFFNGYFDPRYLIHPKGLKIYKTFIESVNNSQEKETIEKGVLKSISFVIDYCNNNNIKSFNQYIYDEYEILSTLLKHYNAGSITAHFVVMIPNILHILDGFPQDTVSSYMDDIRQHYTELRALAINNSKLRYISDNLEKIINEKIINNNKEVKEI